MRNEQDMSTSSIWALNHKIRKLGHVSTLWLFLPEPARVRWSATDEQATETEYKRATVLSAST